MRGCDASDKQRARGTRDMGYGIWETRDGKQMIWETYVQIRILQYPQTDPDLRPLWALP